MSRCSSHHEWGHIGYKFRTWGRFFNLLGFTDIFDNPDSWEGWLWGTAHAYGFWWRLGVPEQSDLLEDGLKHSELIIHWSNDPDATGGLRRAESTIWRVWLKELEKQIFIDSINKHCGHYGDKWIAPRLGTDACRGHRLCLASRKALTTRTILPHTIGFEIQRPYFRKNDGIPKNLKWVSESAPFLRGHKSSTWSGFQRTALAGNARRREFAGQLMPPNGQGWQCCSRRCRVGASLGKHLGTMTGAPFNDDFDFPGYASMAGG
jgi:trimethylamine-N-oxide reductase (cytochrome c)